MKIEANGKDHKELNERIRNASKNGEREIRLEGVNGQRYIGAALESDLKIQVEGVPGNDLAAFMDGPTIEVDSNGQDVIGNTMNSGKVILHGHAGDIVGHSMRGGKIFVEGEIGYRAGIHMKAYKELHPVMIVGGKAGDFLGEYMAGGLLIVLGINGNGSDIVGSHVGTGMHGGEIYIRGEVKEHQIGEGVGMEEPAEKDLKFIEDYLEEYADDFDMDVERIMDEKFVKLSPETHRPYGKIYAY